MKKIQMKLGSRIFAFEVKDDCNMEDDLQNALADHIHANNEDESIIFYEEVEIICSECGVSLNLDEEQEDGMCVSCSGGNEE